MVLIYVFVCLFLVLEIKSRASCILGKHCTTELHAQLQTFWIRDTLYITTLIIVPSLSKLKSSQRPPRNSYIKSVGEEEGKREGVWPPLQWGCKVTGLSSPCSCGQFVQGAPLEFEPS